MYIELTQFNYVSLVRICYFYTGIKESFQLHQWNNESACITLRLLFFRTNH